jgi:hypothetical protein
MHALEVIHRILRTRVTATVEEHEQIMAAFNEIVRALEPSLKGQPAPAPAPAPADEIPMPGKVSGRSAAS